MKKLVGSIAVWLVTSAFTPARPTIRYRIDNQSNQSISTIIQLESDDSSFAEADITEVSDDLAGGYVGHCYNRNHFKRYIKLIIQTNAGRYSTPSFAYKDRCTAYTIEFTERAISVRDDAYYRLRSQVFPCLLIFLITFFLKGLPFILNDRLAIKAVLVPFLVLNCGLAISFLFLVQGGFPGLSSLLYALATTFILELVSYYWLSSATQQRNQLVTAALLGSLLWIGAGLPSALLVYFLFGGC